MEAPRLPSMFKGAQRQPRGMRYRPVYYNPEQEELREKLKRLRATKEGDELESAMLEARMRHKLENNKRRVHQQSGAKGRGARLTVILSMLVSLVYYVFKYYFKFS